MPHIRGHRNGGAGGPNRNQNNRNGKPIGNGRRSQRNQTSYGGNRVRSGRRQAATNSQLGPQSRGLAKSKPGPAMGLIWPDVCKYLGIGCNQPPAEGWWDQYCQWLPGGCGGGGSTS